MNLKHVQGLQAAHARQWPHGHAHFWERAALTRRQFLKAGAATVAVAAFGGLWKPTRAIAAPPTGGSPRPVPGTTQIDGLGSFHFFFPTLGNPPGSIRVIENGTGDPSTITDFNGHIGVSEMSGGTGVDNLGVTQYWKSDVRFMDGEYIDVNGAQRQGTFAFVWLDIYSSQVLTPPNQVHDFNPGIKDFVSKDQNGLFWTVVLPRDSVNSKPGAGRASLHVSDLDMDDYGNVVNALQDGPEKDGSVSIDLEWSGVLSRHNFSNAAIGFAGEYAHTSARLSWTASNSDGYHFAANPLSNGFAEVGTSRNGVFF